MKSVRLLDSFALVRYLLAEPGGDRVREWFLDAARHQAPLLISELNLGEVFYVIARRVSLGRAEEVLRLLPTMPMKLLPVSWSTILQAARFKAQYALSYADCVAAASALEHHAILVTGDPEFRSLKHLVGIEWV